MNESFAADDDPYLLSSIAVSDRSLVTKCCGQPVAIS